jgi:hypothetical protein
MQPQNVKLMHSEMLMIPKNTFSNLVDNSITYKSNPWWHYFT